MSGDLKNARTIKIPTYAMTTLYELSGRPVETSKNFRSVSANPVFEIGNFTLNLRRFAQAKAQDPARLLGGFEQVAAGGRTEMREILDRTRVGRQHFEHRTGGKRLQRAARLQHRQRAQQPGRVEGGVGRGGGFSHGTGDLGQRCCAGSSRSTRWPATRVPVLSVLSGRDQASLAPFDRDSPRLGGGLIARRNTI